MQTDNSNTPSLDDLALVPVTSEKIERIWPHVRRYVESFLRHADGLYEADDIKSALVARDMQLWVAVRENRIQALGVTQIVRHPRASICHLVGVAGDNRRLIARFEKDVSAWAQANGCRHFEALARRGWLKVLPEMGWRAVGTVVRKEIASGGHDGRQ